MKLIRFDVRVYRYLCMGMFGQHSFRIGVSYKASAFFYSRIDTKNKMVPLFATKRKRVLMTGFGPFGEISTNPSWEGVKFINGSEIENNLDIILFRKEIAVNYDEVDTNVPQMWYYYQPHLTIHVGLSGDVPCFVLEKKAKKHGYKLADNAHQYAKGYQNACHGHDVVYTNLDVETICRKFNHCKRKLQDHELHAKPSEDAGLFLCEYIYYSSLYHGRSPTLFVHVPLKYTPQQLARGLERILELCLKQLPNDDYNSYHIV